MTSLVLSPKYVQREMFHAFSHFLFIDGAYIVTSTSNEEAFIWEIHKYVPVKEGWRGKGVGDLLYTHKINRSEEVALRSTSLCDYIDFFSKEYRNMVDSFYASAGIATEENAFGYLESEKK